jgi:hypothetical protein
MDTGDSVRVFTTANPHPLAGSSGNEDASAGAAEIDDERAGLEQEAEDEEEDEELSRDLLAILHVSLDGMRLGE